jgi:hypothetical protein
MVGERVPEKQHGAKPRFLGVFYIYLIYCRILQFVVYSNSPQTKGKVEACTQPRRVAAMSVVKRVAEEMDGTVGLFDQRCDALHHF